MPKTVMIVAFHNQQALGARYLANAAEGAGYYPLIVYFKEFNSISPTPASEIELGLLRSLVDEYKPVCVGFSVMSSMYLDTVRAAHGALAGMGVPLVWGGAFPSLMPERAMDYCDYVVRGEGEGAFAELLKILEESDGMFPDESKPSLKNLVWRDGDGSIVVNDLRPLTQEIDTLGYPKLTRDNVRFIHHDRMTDGAFQFKALTYDLTASRGCPFACSYCSSINLRRLYSGERYVRFRSVDSVMEELRDAKSKIKNLSLVHFWDEIFSDEEGWVADFTSRYKKEIGLPFTIWGHPLMSDPAILRLLVGAGLDQAVIGIQSGSPRIRREVFNRTESQEQILEAGRNFVSSGIPNLVYDFLLGHPFESIDDLRESFGLLMELEEGFSLQVHGLHFLPATDIVQKAIDAGIITPEEMESILWSPMSEQYGTWFVASGGSQIKAVWLDLIFLTQFPRLKPRLSALAKKLDACGEDDGALPPELARSVSKLKLEPERKLARAQKVRKGMLAVKGILKRK